MIKRLLLKPLYSLYESSLRKQIHDKRMPQHIGIILDGNRRHAKTVGIPVEKVYEMGSKKLEAVLDWLWDLNVKVVSVWIFSTENFKRDSLQVEQIMKIAEKKTIQIREDDIIHERKVQVRYSGNLALVPKSLQNQIDQTEDATEMYDKHILNVCLAYGGRAELTSAVKKIANHVKEGNLDIKMIDEDLITQYLYTNGLPDPELIIRTSGSIRLSGFLMWQSTYSELYFTDVLWPNFRKIDLYRAVRDFQLRNRNFGG